MILCNNVQEQARDISVLLHHHLEKLLGKGDFVLGEEVEKFEAWMSQRCNGAYAISLNSGTDALFLALRALGVGAGDEVITCANTFVATVGAIVASGATPILADVGDDELLNVNTIEPLMSSRTKAVIPVYLRGRSLDVDPIIELCRSRGVAVIEDCAQAIGTTHNGCQVGTRGDASAFSMHPLKTLGGFGDGGMLVTRSNKIAQYARKARNHGLVTRSESALFGINSRLDSLQALVLNIKSRYLDLWLARKLEIAKLYNCALSDTVTSIDLGGGKNGGSYYHYVVQTKFRDELQVFLGNNDIQSAVHYPIPIHRQEAWLKSQSGIHLPNTERLSQEMLTLPCHHHLTNDDVEKVVSALKSFELMKFSRR